MPYKSRPPGSLKSAVSELVDACGGQNRVAEFLGVGKTTVQKWTDADRENADKHMSAHNVWLLERLCGQPIVTAFLAAEARAVLLRLPRLEDGAPLGAQAAVLARDISDMYGEISFAMADGKVEAGEAGEIIAKLDKALAAATALRAAAVGIRDGKP